MDDDTIRVAVGLRLGTPLCEPHQCSLCGAKPMASAPSEVRDAIPDMLS